MSWKRNYFASGGGGGTQGVLAPPTMTSITASKGLSNEPGQNSCFLNSALQVPEPLQSEPTLPGTSWFCWFCSRGSVRTRQNKVMEPSRQTRTDEEEEDPRKKQLRVRHQSGAGSPLRPGQENRRRSAAPWIISTDCNQAVKMLESREKATPSMFGELLRNASMGDLRSCPSQCGQQLRMARVLLNSPEIITIGLVWDSEHSDLAEDVIHSLGTCLRLGDLFYRVTEEKARQAELYLVGMVCYYGKHYSTFFFQTKVRRWMYFDDAHVKEVRSLWSLAQVLLEPSGEQQNLTMCLVYRNMLRFCWNPAGNSRT
uniref:Peptidase C19 ubiquitin carboxyl-terminal hydrolase domain-containing protein n=1 Tax=Fundulus heteroclitus TaxID=8078 RepID=A0A3Q2UK86_FUNHE